MGLPVIDFLISRLQEYDGTFELRKGTPYHKLYFQPLEFIVQPVADEIANIQLNQSFKKIVDLADPNNHPEDGVDGLAGNLFVYRITGAKAGGVARVFYREAIERVFAAGALEFKNSAGLIYTNTQPINVSAIQMGQNFLGDQYYIDVQIEASAEGEEYNVDEEGIIIVSDGTAIAVTNPAKIKGGLPRELNLDLISRTKKSIGVRDLNTGKGVNAIMFENFGGILQELQPIGFMDPEMQRDIVYNVHVGGRIDVFVKTQSLTSGSMDIVGLLVDRTRRVSQIINLTMAGTAWVGMGVSTIDVTEQPVRATSLTPNRPASFVSYVDLTDGVDLSSVDSIRVGVGSDERNVRIVGALPSRTLVNEIVQRINITFNLSLAKTVINPTILSRRSSGNVTAGSAYLVDSQRGAFENVAAGDMIYVFSGGNLGTYYVLAKVDDNTLLVDRPFAVQHFDMTYRITRVGTFIKFETLNKGADIFLSFMNPTIGVSALAESLGIVAPPVLTYGRGPATYNEGFGYAVDYENAAVQRIRAANLVSGNAGQFSAGMSFVDTSHPQKFLNVIAGDVLTITGHANPAYNRDYRVIEKRSDTELRLEYFFQTSSTGVSYSVHRTEILDGDTVNYTFDYNPLSVDVGNQIQLDAYGRTRGVRPGRTNQTIKDMAFIDITQVELIDPVTKEPMDTILQSMGGYGRGGFGQGGYGRGSGSEFFLKVNKPELRFSAWEDSLIIIDSAYEAQSFRVSYRYDPQIPVMQAFCDSDAERVLDGHVLAKHFLPAFVSLSADYSPDPNNPATPSEAEVITAVEAFILSIKSGGNLDVSDIIEVIQNTVDPSRAGGTRIKLPITVSAKIHNTDGSLSVISSSDSLQVPNDPIPSKTDRPLSPRIVHWIPDSIDLRRI